MSLDWRSVALIAIAVIALLLMREGCNQATIEDMRGEKAALADSLRVTRNSLHQETASRIAWQSSSKYFKGQVNEVGDSLLKILMKNTGKGVISSTIGRVETISGGSSWPDKWYQPGDSCPSYHKTFVTPWDSVDITADSRGIRYSYVSNNSFRVEQSLKKNGWFKKPDLQVSLFNENPNTRTLGLQSFHVNYPDHRFGVGPIVGVGWSKDLIPSPIIGVGITYSILKF